MTNNDNKAIKISTEKTHSVINDFSDSPLLQNQRKDLKSTGPSQP